LPLLLLMLLPLLLLALSSEYALFVELLLLLLSNGSSVLGAGFGWYCCEVSAAEFRWDCYCGPGCGRHS